MNISLQKKVQLWFNFLRLAHQCGDPVVIRNLKGSESFYAQWGDFKTMPFTKWWAAHRHLFREVSTVRKMPAGEVATDDALHLVIPFSYSPTAVGKIVQRIYSEEQDRRVAAKTKVKKVYGGTYSLSTVDFQASQFVYYHLYAKDVYLPLTDSGKNVSTKDFIELAQEVFARQRQVVSHDGAKRGVPFKDSSTVYGNLSKRARDFNRIVMNILRNVSAGVFPGDYVTVSVKNQRATRKSTPKVSVRKYARGVSESRYVDRKRREDAFDPYAKRLSR
jgi:hypothetical protein